MIRPARPDDRDTIARFRYPAGNPHLEVSSDEGWLIGPGACSARSWADAVAPSVGPAKSRIPLTVVIGNTAARRIHQKHGFRVVAEKQYSAFEGCMGSQ